ncbi:MAG TPA: hypothetical protein VIZ21_06905 [Ignavibacteriaceae bacterium]
MQKVTKDEFLQASDYPDLYVKTKDKEYAFEEKSYTVSNDTILGKGEYILKIKPENNFKPFEGKIYIKDVDEIKTDSYKSTSDTANLIVLTSEKEYIFKFDENTYSVSNDTIYGKGKCRLINVDNQFEGMIDVSLNDTEEIQIDKFNPGTTITLASVLVLAIVGIIAIVDGVGNSIW